MSGPGKGDALGYNTEQVEAIGEGINTLIKQEK